MQKEKDKEQGEKDSKSITSSSVGISKKAWKDFLFGIILTHLLTKWLSLTMQKSTENEWSS